MENSRMKVVWICKFANQDLISYFGNDNVKEGGPWINGLIDLFGRIDTIELHIIAPNVFVNKDVSFQKGGITYHLFKEKPLLISNKIDRFIRWNYRTDFYFVKEKVRRIVDRIKPDIVHLHGAENAHYSAVILPLLGRYKTMITIQGFIMDSSPDGLNKYLRRRRIEVEKIILSKGHHFGIDCDFMADKVKTLNPGAIFHKHQYPVTVPEISKNNDGEPGQYDCVFFARICKDKGIIDLLKAISIAKKTKPDISVNVIGSSDKKYLKYLNNLCQELKIEENITFSGFFATQKLLFQEVLKAEISVLPTYHDTLPGTVVESMFMKIPVVAYNVGGLTELNKQNTNIILVDKGNIEDLASKILYLSGNKEYRKQLGEMAYQTIRQWIKPDEIVHDILNAYKQISLSNL